MSIQRKGTTVLTFRYLAESYLETEEGRQEAERAKREGSRLYMEAKKRVLRPDVAGGVMGLGMCYRYDCEARR